MPRNIDPNKPHHDDAGETPTGPFGAAFPANSATGPKATANDILDG
jgi:hypothetical protein